MQTVGDVAGPPPEQHRRRSPSSVPMPSPAAPAAETIQIVVNRQQLFVGLAVSTFVIVLALTRGFGAASPPSPPKAQPGQVTDPRLRALLGIPGRWENVTLDPALRETHPSLTYFGDVFGSSGSGVGDADTPETAVGAHGTADEIKERSAVAARRAAVYNARYADPVTCVQPDGPRVDLVVGVPFVDVSAAATLEFDAVRPTIATITKSYESGIYPGLGLAHAGFEARLCGLCSVTIVRAVVDPLHNASAAAGSSRVVRDRVGEKMYEETFVAGSKATLVDRALCGAKHRPVRHVSVTVGSSTLPSWHDAMHAAVDEIAASVASKHAGDRSSAAPLVAFVDAATPPEQPLSRWLTALVHGNAAAYQAELADAEVRETISRRNELQIPIAEAGNRSQIPLGFGSVHTDPFAGPYTERLAAEEPAFVPAGDGVLLGCPNLFNYGDDAEAARSVDRHSVRIESFGLTADMLESKHTVVFHKQFHDMPRMHAGAQRDAAVDALAPNCFLTTPATWARVRAAQRKVEPGSEAATDTAVERVAHLTLAVAGLHGIATESAAGREELTSLVMALEELFHCTDHASSDKAGAGPLLSTRRFCFRLQRAKEMLLDVAMRAEGVRTTAAENFRREASAMKRFRDTGDDKPIAEVVRRWTVSKSVLAALESAHENYACAVRRNGVLHYCLEKEMLDPAVKIAGRAAAKRYIRDLNELPDVASLANAAAVLRAKRAEIAADKRLSAACRWCDPECELSSLAATTPAPVTPADDDDDEEEVDTTRPPRRSRRLPRATTATTTTTAPPRRSSRHRLRTTAAPDDDDDDDTLAPVTRRPLKKFREKGKTDLRNGVLPTNVQNRVRECVAQRRAVERRVLAAVHRFTSVVHNSTLRAVLAMQNVTMLTPSAQSTLSWARFVTAAHATDTKMVVRAQACTSLRNPPYYVVPRAVSRNLKVAWQSPLLDREIHMGLNINGKIVRTFERLALSRFATTGARVQLNTPCGCGTEVLLNTWLTNALRHVIPTRVTMSPVCRCWTSSPVSEFEGMFSAFGQNTAPSYHFQAGNGRILQERRWPQLPRADDLGDLGKARVVEIQIHHGDPGSAANFEKAETGGVDYVVSRVSPLLFSTLPPGWVIALNDDSRYDEVWVPHGKTLLALVSAGINPEKIFVVPETVDTDKFYPTNGHNVPLPWPDWKRDRIGGQRPFAPETDMPLRKNLKFFANFRWQPAAGWDEVLRGFFNAFTSSDEVSLYIKSVYWAPSKIEGATDERDGESMIRQAIILGGMEGFHDQKKLPHFELLTDHFGDNDLRGLYKEADVFVSLPHADTFGIQLAQAFAMAKPIIATRCSALAAAAPEDTAIFVESEMGTVPAEVAALYGLRNDTEWCEPRAHEVVAAMKRMVRMTRAERFALGRRARQWFVETHGPTVVAQQVARRVAAIEKKVRERWLAGTAVAAPGVDPLTSDAPAVVSSTTVEGNTGDGADAVVTTVPSSGSRKRRQLIRDRAGNWQLPPAEAPAEAVTPQAPVTDAEETAAPPATKRGTKPRRRTL